MALHDRYRASNLRAYDGALAARYEDSLPVRVLRVWELDDFVIGELGSEITSLSILDVGCATGRLLARLAAAGAKRICGADVAPAILELARMRLRDAGADLRLADAEANLPWPDGAFDVVSLTGVFHHFTRPARALGEIRRVLRPGGRVLMADACFFTPLREVMNGCLLIRPRDGDFRFYRPGDASRILSRSGLQVNLVRRLNWWSYGAVGVRPLDSLLSLDAEAAGERS
ncbi:MAG: class I SAM-dependent methyltransferase [Candidatus Eisenbacteria bacterium]|nr:class I SAM-dependent methyltransferase [Candidatus Eisenbacteria bacterium]